LALEHHPLFPGQVFDLGQRFAGIGHRGAGIFRGSTKRLGYLTGILGQLPPAFLAVSQALRDSTALFVLVAELLASPAKGLGYLPAFFALTPEQFCFLPPPLGVGTPRMPQPKLQASSPLAKWPNLRPRQGVAV
jgi:hypothetical protein